MDVKYSERTGNQISLKWQEQRQSGLARRGNSSAHLLERSHRAF